MQARVTDTTSINDINFKDFILNENRILLAQKVGDILSALQDLNDNMKSIGTRMAVRNIENIVNQIRKILRTKWPDRDQNHIKNLQKCGVFLMKNIEEKNDLEFAIKTSINMLQKIVNSTQDLANNLASPQ